MFDLSKRIWDFNALNVLIERLRYNYHTEYLRHLSKYLKNEVHCIFASFTFVLRNNAEENIAYYDAADFAVAEYSI